jgi:hypothetical protein
MEVQQFSVVHLIFLDLPNLVSTLTVMCPDGAPILWDRTCLRYVAPVLRC